MKNYLFVLSIVSLLIVSCAPKLSSSFVKEGYTDNKYAKIAVVGISNELSNRLAFEKEAVKLFKENGINAIEGNTVFPKSMKASAEDTSQLIKVIKDNNLDGVITMSLVDTKDSNRYVPGSTYDVPAGYYRVGRYIGRRYVTVNEPGYYEPTKSYVIEAILYNTKGNLTGDKDNWVWTGASDLVNPSSVKSAASTFAKEMVNTLINEGVVAAE